MKSRPFSRREHAEFRRQIFCRNRERAFRYSVAVLPVNGLRVDCVSIVAITPLPLHRQHDFLYGHTVRSA
ncbi:hypothetical protein LGM46_11910 [Burkholderia arboris]|uniref:hypothetical protein n=1 Tax=Burkholderia arboris TaxID=488730 RepID=UPI001CF36B77|nr:hypothetical protein [Burkholderia arboris]MCA8033691.1 hypothetical protein [Burkholderia arboris]